MKIHKYLPVSLVSICLGYYISEITLKKYVYKSQNTSDKHLALFLLMNQWVKIRQENKNIASYLEQKGYRTIAIYGMSYAGERLYNELRDSTVEIKYVIDNAVVRCNVMCNVVTSQDQLEYVDAIIVTPIFYFDDIYEKLSKKINCPIISLEDILYEM